MNKCLFLAVIFLVCAAVRADPLACLQGRYIGLCAPGLFAAEFIGDDRAIYSYIDGGPRLGLFDVSDPAAHVLLGSVSLPESAVDIEVQGDLVGVALYFTGLDVFRLNGDGFEFVSQVDFKDDVWGFEMNGTTALVTSGPSLYSIDLSDPSSPVVLDAELSPVDYRLYGSAYGHGSVYIGSDEGVARFRVEDPTDIGPAEFLGEHSNCLDLEIDGDYLYAAMRGRGLAVFDIADPDHVQQIASIQTLGDCKSIEKSGNHIFVAEREFGFSVIDVSDPAFPELVGEYCFDYEPESLVIDRVAGVLYVHLYDIPPRCAVVEIAPDRPGTALLGSHQVLNRPWDAVARGGYAYFAEENTVLVLDVADTAQLTETGFVETNGSARGIEMLDVHTLAAAVGGGGLAVIDVSDPSTPMIESTVDFPGFAQSLALRDRTAFVASHQGGLTSIDLSDPLSPRVRSAVSLAGYAVDVAVQGTNAFVATSDGGVAVLDVSDPDAMVVVGTDSGSYSASSVAVSDSLLALGTMAEGCRIFDISDLTHPVLLASIPFEEVVRGVAFDHGVLFASVENSGVYAYSLKDPFTPELLGVQPLDGRLGRLGFDAGVAYVGVPGTVYALDISGSCTACPADLNTDGSLNFFDVSAFLVGYQEQSPDSDWNGDGAWNFFDVSGFLVDFKAGCP